MLFIDYFTIKFGREERTEISPEDDLQHEVRSQDEDFFWKVTRQEVTVTCCIGHLQIDVSSKQQPNVRYKGCHDQTAHLT